MFVYWIADNKIGYQNNSDLYLHFFKNANYLVYIFLALVDGNNLKITASFNGLMATKRIHFAFELNNQKSNNMSDLIRLLFNLL